MKILKQIKTWGLATALVGSFVAFADWWCPNCQRYHCDYECCPYDCNDLLSISDSDFDSDDAKRALDIKKQRMQIELQRDQARIQRGHSKNMGKICSSMWKHVHTPADVQRIYDALRQIASANLFLCHLCLVSLVDMAAILTVDLDAMMISDITANTYSDVMFMVDRIMITDIAATITAISVIPMDATK